MKQTKDISEKLLEYYKKHYNEAPKDNTHVLLNYLREKDLEFGICSAASGAFDEGIYNDEWVKNYCINDSCYWAIMPNYSESVEEILQALEIRINKLKERVKVIKKQRREEKKASLSSL